ncbi:hypothetical protein GLYMA_18G059250v4 [Glycine max]|nr:hypothetical protein GLYMA_18G059250v4 [Glycine max]KAH1153412.1 hypothetical protein GYH30_049166 [Glycine max]
MMFLLVLCVLAFCLRREKFTNTFINKLIEEF